MSQRLFDDVSIGDELSGYVASPSTAQLMRYCGVTWNMHRIHFDHPHAAEEGYPGVLVQSHLHQAFLTKLVTDWMGPKGRLRTLTNTVRRFATTDDQLKLHGKVVEVSPVDDNSGLVTVEIEEVRLRDDVVCAPGRAVIELPRKG